MIVLTFLQRFAPLVLSGAKPHTIRRERKRPVKVGDHLSLRQWSGRPYMTPQIRLRDVVCTAVHRIELKDDIYPTVWIDGERLTVDDMDSLAARDGFAGFNEMMGWFRDKRGLPFVGTLICWDPKAAAPITPETEARP